MALASEIVAFAAFSTLYYSIFSFISQSQSAFMETFPRFVPLSCSGSFSFGHILLHMSILSYGLLASGHSFQVCSFQPNWQYRWF